MTISTQNRTAGPFAGNGVTAAFPFTFKVFQASDLKVVRRVTATDVETTLVLNSNYTVTLNPNQNANPGGVVTLSSALATGQTLTVTTELPYLQATDLTNQGGFYPQVITNALDRLTIFAQQLFAGLGRSLKYPLSDSGIDPTLPGKDALRGRVLAFHETTGRPIAGPSTTSVGTVGGAIGAIQTVADNIADVNTVAGDINDVNAVGQNIGDVNDVADNLAAVGIVANNIADVNLVAANIDDVTHLADVYLGPRASDPSTRTDGSPLQAGDLYFNTETDRLRVYTGSRWSEANTGAVSVQQFTGDGVTVDFQLNSAPDNENVVQVFIDGVYQSKTVYDITGPNANILTFTSPPPNGAAIEAVTFSVLPLGVVDASQVQMPGGGTLDQIADPDSDVLVGGVEAGTLTISVGSIKDLATVPKIDGRQYSLAGFYAGSTIGGGQFVWKASESKVNHNGVNVIDPLRATAWDGSPADLVTLFSAAGAGSGCFVRLDKNVKATECGYVPSMDLGYFYSVVPLKKLTHDISGVINTPVILDGFDIAFGSGVTMSVGGTFDVINNTHAIQVTTSIKWSGAIRVDLGDKVLGGVSLNSLVLQGEDIEIINPNGDSQARTPVFISNCTGEMRDVSISGGANVGVCDGVRVDACSDLKIGDVMGVGYGYRLLALVGSLTKDVNVNSSRSFGPGQAFYSNNTRGCEIGTVFSRNCNRGDPIKLSRGTTNCTIKYVDIVADVGAIWGLAIQGSSNNKILDGSVLLYTNSEATGATSAVRLEDHPEALTPCNNNYVKVKFGMIGGIETLLAAGVFQRVNGLGLKDNVLELTAIDPSNAAVKSNIRIDSNGFAIGRTVLKGGLYVNRENSLAFPVLNDAIAASSSGGSVPLVEVQGASAYSLHGRATSSVRLVANSYLRTVNGAVAAQGTVIHNNVYRGGSALGGSNVESTHILNL